MRISIPEPNIIDDLNHQPAGGPRENAASSLVLA